MLHSSKIISQGQGLAPVLLKRAHTVALDWDLRQKSRFNATDSAGRQFGVFLPRGTVVRGGDVLVAEDGSLVRVIAAPQRVLHISHCTQHGTPFDLVRAAYHLGNRHVPIELKPDHLKIEPDHVLADLLRAMHLIVREDTLAFEPESGAYAAQGHGHRPDPAHDHAHDEPGHDHGHDHNHGHDHAHDEPGHDHDHGHDHPHHPTAPGETKAPAPASAKKPPVHEDSDHQHDHGHSSHDGHKH